MATMTADEIKELMKETVRETTAKVYADIKANSPAASEDVSSQLSELLKESQEAKIKTEWKEFAGSSWANSSQSSFLSKQLAVIGAEHQIKRMAIAKAAESLATLPEPSKPKDGAPLKKGAQALLDAKKDLITQIATLFKTEFQPGK